MDVNSLERLESSALAYSRDRKPLRCLDHWSHACLIVGYLRLHVARRAEACGGAHHEHGVRVLGRHHRIIRNVAWHHHAVLGRTPIHHRWLNHKAARVILFHVARELQLLLLFELFSAVRVVALVAVRTCLALVKELARLGFELRTRTAIAEALIMATPWLCSLLEPRRSAASVAASPSDLDGAAIRGPVRMTALRLILIFRSSRPPLIVILGVGLLSLLSKLALTLAIVGLLDVEDLLVCQADLFLGNRLNPSLTMTSLHRLTFSAQSPRGRSGTFRQGRSGLACQSAGSAASCTSRLLPRNSLLYYFTE